jgi:hypothetical protein
MKVLDDHPDRAEMLKAIKSGTVPFASHLDCCPACRQLFELLLHYGAAGRGPHAEPSPESVYRHIAIARLAESRRPKRTLAGSVVYDSWAQLPALQMREAALDGERRLRLAASEYSMEFIADRQLKIWDFVARVYDRDTATSEFILQIGRKKLYIRAHQCYFWSAKNPPRRIQLLSPSFRIDFGRLRW